MCPDCFPSCTGGKDVKRHLNEVRAARMLPQVTPTASMPTSPAWSPRSSMSGGKMLRPSQAGSKDVEAAVNSPREVRTSAGGSRPVSFSGAGLLAKAFEKQCPDGHVAALEGHHSAHMADGLMLEEEEEEQLLEFKETAGEVGFRDTYGANREPTLLHHEVRDKVFPSHT